MQTELSKEQILFRDVVGRALRARSTPEVVRELMASEEGYDPAVWRELCGEVGLTAVHIPEEYGGLGYGAVELGIVAEEMGRTLFCGPFFPSAVMAGHALLEGATEEAKAFHLPGIASGETIAALVLDSVSSSTEVGESVRIDTAGSLSGTAGMVPDAHVAGLLVVAAAAEGGLGLYAVDPGAPGVAIEPRQALDPTRKLSRVSFEGVAAERIGSLSEAGLERLWESMCVALDHEMLGGAQQLLESTVEYTKVRHQFGRPIGSFQALKHRCADLLMEVELTRALVRHAAFCLASAEGEPYAASMAKAMASDTYMSAARAGIQLRGGIGFTWENDTHLWFKRAKASEVFLGTPAWHRERMMKLLERAS